MRWMIFAALAALALTAFQIGSQQASAQYPPTIGSLTATSSATSGSTDSTVDITCTVRDTAGNPVQGEPCTFTIVSQPGSDASVGSLSVTKNTDGQGMAVATLKTGSTPGTIVVSVEASGITSQVSVAVSGQGAPAAGLPETGGSVADDGTIGFPVWLAVALGLASAVAVTTFGLRALRKRA